MQFAVTASAALPALIVILRLSLSPLFDRPGLAVWLAFCLGAVSINAVDLKGMLIDMPPFQSWEQPRLIVPIYFFFIAAPVEELGKLAALLATLWLFSLHRRPLALLGCGLAVGVGFACLENYRFGLQHGFEEALSRIGGFLLHAVLTGIAAIFIAFGFIMPQRRWRYWLSAICIPITFHGAHNFSTYCTQMDRRV